jgi:hypothetical protein
MQASGIRDQRQLTAKNVEPGLTPHEIGIGRVKGTEAFYGIGSTVAVETVHECSEIAVERLLSRDLETDAEVDQLPGEATQIDAPLIRPLAEQRHHLIAEPIDGD